MAEPNEKSSNQTIAEDDKRTHEFGAELIRLVNRIADEELNPVSGLRILTRLMAEIPFASKEKLDQVKIMDKLTNSARYMMEAKLKNEEALLIMRRLDELETQMEKMAEKQAEMGALPESFGETI